jgi:hypothetical protein
MNNEEKSFIDYFIENQQIETNGLKCIRTYGWGEKAVVRVEYAAYHKDYKPIALEKKYLKECYGYCPQNQNFNNVHYDRIGRSALMVYDTTKDDFNKYCELPTVLDSEYYEKEDWGYIALGIHNDKQRELSYAGKLSEYYQ